MRTGRWWLLGVVVMAAARAAPAATAPFEVPPLMQPPVAAEHPGKLIWAELMTPDVAAAKRFYGGLFGWTFRDIHAPSVEYSVALLDGAPIAGFVQRTMRPPGKSQPAWVPFFSVPSVHAAAQAIAAQGGRQLVAPRAVRHRGQQAVYADPQGAVFAVCNSHSGDPPDVLAAPGEWIWSALVTKDPQADAAFYRDVFGFEVFDLPSGTRGAHLVLASEQYARASVNPLPRDGNVRPHWIDFVRVASAADTAARAGAVGGRVLVEPHADRHGGLVALLADPAGALIGVMEWNAATDAGAAK
ncbi:MAG TPA: VOC family protein [Steroidobacteraceae bacterium]|nr:VOC family protein [Steroidobacteraceae bacterium]